MIISGGGTVNGVKVSVGGNLSFTDSNSSITSSTASSVGSSTVTKVPLVPPVSNLGSGATVFGGISQDGSTLLLRTLVGRNGITVTNNDVSVVISGDGGGGGGGSGLSQIIAGTGLTGGTITASGTIALANTQVVPGAYTLASVTVDQQGRVTSASNGTVTGVLMLAGGVMTGSLSLAADPTASHQAATKQYVDVTVSSAVNNGVKTITNGVVDCSLGSNFTGTISSITSFSFTNPPAVTTNSGAFSLTIALTNAGSQTITWPASVRWANGIVPTLTSSGKDVLTFLTLDGGVTWYGSLVLRNLS